MTGQSGFSGLLDYGPFEAVQPRDDEVAMVLYTSGSTGRPKGVPLTHKGHLWALRKRMTVPSASEHRLLVAAPLYHMNALCVSLFALAASAREILLPEFDAVRYSQGDRAVRLHLDHVSADDVGNVPCRARSTGWNGSWFRADRPNGLSADLAKTLVTGQRRPFAGANIMNGYGTTEAGPIVFGPRAGHDVPDLSVGFQAAEVDIKLIDENGREADQGVLWHRTPATMSAYLNLPEKTAQVLTEDGWYISGDVFRRNETGAYFFVGRADDMFVCGGENIYPGEIEALLVGHPAIVQACVVPVPDEIKGEKPVAFIVTEADETLSEQSRQRLCPC